MSDPSAVADYYDDYTERQVAVGVNERHRAIAAAMRRAGWRQGQRVLEIGAGVGTLTELLLEGVGAEGMLHAIDLSPKSIQLAAVRLGSPANLQLSAGDILEMELNQTFDVIVLPDVIEHIPLELHGRLFGRLRSWLADDGFVFLNYPNPYYLAWCREHRPDVLQIIDQPVYADVLARQVYASGLYFHSLETYAIWIEQGDYTRAVLRVAASATTFTELPTRPPSLGSRFAHRAKALLGGRH